MKTNKEVVKSIIDNIKPAQLVAATKYVDVQEINKLEECGCIYFGENRVQDFLRKYEQYHGKGKWISLEHCKEIK